MSGTPGVKTAGRWRLLAATALGGAHRRSGTVNQDAHRVAVLDGAAVLVVSDGHGSERSFRSDRGARLAVDAGIQLAGHLLATAAADADDSVAELTAHVPGFAEAMVGEWRRSVLADAAVDPLDADTVVDDDVLLVYGATLLLAVLAERVAVFVQVGDGDLVVRSVTGETAPAVAKDDRLVAGETTSLCHLNVARDLRWSVRDLAAEPVALVLAATDGYGNAFADDDWQRGVGDDLVALADAEGLAWIAGQLASWTDESALTAGDDVTVALAFGAGYPS